MLSNNEKQKWIAQATPNQIVERYPFEYTLNMRMGPSKWHLSASLMSELEQKMFRLASEVRQFEMDFKK